MAFQLFKTVMIILMSLSGILSFLGCKGNTQSSKKTISQPPFSIKKRNVVDRQYKFNEGTISKFTKTKYKVCYKNQDISFPANLDEGTGVPGIWKAYILKDAPTPTIIVGSKNVYLVTEEKEAPKLTLIEKKHSNYASIQWLDSENGNPGVKTEILIGEDTTDCLLKGGQYLLINENTILRIADLTTFSFNRMLDYTDDYYPGNVVAFSPDKNKIVFLGSKSHPTNRTEYIYAMLVYNFRNNQVYALPFGKTETRLHEPHSIESSWFNTYFEWKQNESGNLTLAKKELAQLPNWEGYHARNSRYQLSPVKGEMHTTFFNFTKDFLQLNDASIKTKEYGGLEEYTIDHKGFVFNIGYLEELNSVSMSFSFMNKGPEDEAAKIVKKVGDAFNEVLQKGNHQKLFTSY